MGNRSYWENRAYWRKGVLARDNYTCQKSGKKSWLTAHRILSEYEYPDKMFDIDNGITLDFDSHKEFHDRYGYRGFTLENLEEFLGREIPYEQRMHLVAYEVADLINEGVENYYDVEVSAESLVA